MPVERASIMLVTDHSRSMSATDVEPDRLSRGAARGAHVPRPAARRRCASAPSRSPTRPTPSQAPSADHDDARRIVDAPGRRRRHRHRRRAEVALDALKNDQAERQAPAVGDRPALRRQDHRPAAIRSPVARSRGPAEDPDLHGRPRHARRHGAQPQPVRHAAARRARPRDAARRSPQVSGGKAFTAEDAELADVDLQDARLAARDARRRRSEITASFAIGGLVLLLGAAAASLRLAGRLP